MAVSLTVLASGSRGNCSVLATSSTRLLVDAGLSARETFKRLREVGEDCSSFSAIVVTHEHSDHVNGLAALARKLKVPVYLTGATYQAFRRWARDKYESKSELPRVEHFAAGSPFCIGDIGILPFTIPHDAVDPVGFAFRAEGVKIAIATDLGYVPASVADHLRGCDALLIEANHDLEMLRGGPYPWSVKQRVMSRVGHLSNDALADFLAGDYDGSASFLVLGHLSEQNNLPELARRAAERALGTRSTLWQNRLLLASQTQPLPAMRV
ncbi:MAG TPA: MBL fold metallo-hydrolase [Terriglobales bacterium]|nr:MBL fold metallo-hydrolase [Terriglobales bacterium]